MSKVITILLISFIIVYACTSDCVSCHPNLDIENDIRHTPLATCVTCHPPESLKNTDMGDIGCGTDCFQCHSVTKVTSMEQHRVITECIGCHKNMTKYEFENQIKNLNDLNNHSLKSILK